MTLSTTASSISYTADADDDVFAVPFKFNEEADLVVQVTPSGGVAVTKTLGVHYTVNGEGDEGGGTVVFSPSYLPGNLATVTIARTIDIVQEVAFTEQGSFAASVHEEAFDRVTMAAQQLDRRLAVVESQGVLGDLTAGAGLTLTGGTVLAVGAGNGIVANADDVAVNYGGAPANVTRSAASAGAATTVSRSDHKHDISTAAAVELTDSTNAAGSASTVASSDHTHSHGVRAGGTLHAAASGSTAGFMSAADKTKLDAGVAKLFYYAAPAAKSTNGVHAAFAGNTGTNGFPGPFTNPAIPRNVSVTFAASWDGGNVTVNGLDQYGVAVSEVITASGGTTVAGTKIFASVTSASKGTVGATSNTASIGAGDKLGVVGDLVGAFGVLLVNDTAEAVTVDATYDGFTPTTVPNASRNYKLLVNV